MNVTIRSKGHDIIVRGPGRRVRITREWISVSEMVFERVQAEAGNLIEIMPGAVIVPKQAAEPAPEPEPEASAGDSEEVAETPPLPSPLTSGGSKKSRGSRKAKTPRS